jgi:uncharacterized membrane protein HdeD (DUF308 family)
MHALRRFWPVLAVVTGGALLFFEIRRSRGITGENAFWLLIGGLVLVLGMVDLWQGLRRKRGRSNPDPPTTV